MPTLPSGLRFEFSDEAVLRPETPFYPCPPGGSGTATSIPRGSGGRTWPVLRAVQARHGPREPARCDGLRSRAPRRSSWNHAHLRGDWLFGAWSAPSDSAWPTGTPCSTTSRRRDDRAPRSDRRPVSTAVGGAQARRDLDHARARRLRPRPPRLPGDRRLAGLRGLPGSSSRRGHEAIGDAGRRSPSSPSGVDWSTSAEEADRTLDRYGPHCRRASGRSRNRMPPSAATAKRSGMHGCMRASCPGTWTSSATRSRGDRPVHLAALAPAHGAVDRPSRAIRPCPCTRRSRGSPSPPARSR